MAAPFSMTKPAPLCMRITNMIPTLGPESISIKFCN